MLLSLRDSVPAATVEALVEALYAQGQLSSPILPLAGNLMSLQSAREVQELRREVSKLWVALRSLALVGSAPTSPPTTQATALRVADEGVSLQSRGALACCSGRRLAKSPSGGCRRMRAEQLAGR